MPVYMKPISKIETKLGIENGGPVHAFFTNECYRHMVQFVPGGEQGETLNKNVDIQVDSITYMSPSAHYLYNGNLYVDPKYKVGAFPIRNGKISFKEEDGPIEGFVSRRGITKIPTKTELNYTVPGTGAHWDKLMWASKKNEIIKTVQNYMKRGNKS